MVTMRPLLLAAALVALPACTNAQAGYYGSGYLGDAGGGGGASGASKVTLVDIDFTAESTGALTNGASNLLDDGTTDLYGCSVAGTVEIDANGLHFNHTATSAVCLHLSSLSALTNLGDDVARGALIVTMQIDTANSFGTPGSGDGAYLGWYTDGVGATAGAGRVAFLSEIKYNGATWDVDAYGHDGNGQTLAAQVGGIADVPEYVVSDLYGVESRAHWGDSAGFPSSMSDLSEGYTYAGTVRGDAFTTNLQFGNVATYEPSVFIGVNGGGGDLTISRLRIEQIQ